MISLHKIYYSILSPFESILSKKYWIKVYVIYFFIGIGKKNILKFFCSKIFLECFVFVLKKSGFFEFLKFNEIFTSNIYSVKGKISSNGLSCH